MKPNLAHISVIAAFLFIPLGCKEKAPASSPVASEGTWSDDAIAGTYQIERGMNPAGGAYKGTVKLTPAGETYALDWAVGGRGYRGLGIVRGGVLGASWGTNASGGVVVYEIDGGTLQGVWAPQGGTKVSTEVLKSETPRPDGSGEYTIVEAKTAKGVPYSGTVAISPVRDGYRFSWVLSDGSKYDGVGIKQGNVMVVAWPSSGAGVVAYSIDGSRLDGKWAQQDGQLGREVLSR